MTEPDYQHITEALDCRNTGQAFFYIKIYDEEQRAGNHSHPIVYRGCQIEWATVRNTIAPPESQEPLSKTNDSILVQVLDPVTGASLGTRKLRYIDYCGPDGVAMRPFSELVDDVRSDVYNPKGPAQPAAPPVVKPDPTEGILDGLTVPGMNASGAPWADAETLRKQMETVAEICYRFASNAHASQVRKDGETPYFEGHVLQVAETFERGSLEYCVALLHDVAEDQYDRFSDFRKDAEKLHIPGQVIHLVELLTKVKGEPYTAYIERIANYPTGARIKLADISHNLADRPTVDQAVKYGNALRVLLFESGVLK